MTPATRIAAAVEEHADKQIASVNTNRISFKTDKENVNNGRIPSMTKILLN